ncbi:MAG: LPS export ABC transporter periplasmic protein LptC [Proteobacteria bacterium]|nr:LPS export ABC transporter periplasmic protein LptC [Pseudomonadota bacterium]
MGIGVVLATVVFYLLVARIGPVANPISAVIDPEESLKLQDIHFAQTNPDKGLKWFLDASEVKISKDQRTISFINFRLRLEPENKPKVELEGKRGEYDKHSGNISLFGDLKGHMDTGYVITTEEAVFRQEQGDLETDKPVKIIGPFFSVEGRGLYFNVHNETLRILSEAKTTIKDESLIL